MNTGTSSVRPGLALGSSQYEAEATSYLQSRLRIYYWTTFSIATAFYVASSILLQMFPAAWVDRSIWFSADRLTHLGAIVVGSVLLVAIHRRRFSPRALRVLDVVGFYLGTGTTLVIYQEAYTDGPILIPAVIGVFIMLRSVMVPSSAKATVLISLPALVFTGVIQFSHGALYVPPGVAIADESFIVVAAWTQVVLASTVAVAAVASYVNFGLRRQVQEAEQLGQYKLEKKIGEGGMGEVYLATHAMLRRPTAIKLLRPDITGEETIARFEREVRSTSRLSHPNTVSIYDYGRTPDGVFYYAMEFLRGKNLRIIVEETGPMPAARVIHVLRQTCGALAEAHAHGLVHRDVKPGNIVLCDFAQGDVKPGSTALCDFAGGQDVVKLVDFGLVKQLDSPRDSNLTQVGQFCGTPETLAPEILGGDEPTGKSDMYSLAAVGCYLLTGKPIFDATTVSEFVGHHLHTHPIRPSERNAGVPEDLEAILMRCLLKNPDDRPDDIAAMGVALGACVDAGGWTQEQAREWWAAVGA